MQPRECVGKTQQPDGAGEKEERAGGNGDDGEKIEEAHPRSPASSAGVSVALLKNATEAKAASSASVRATSTVEPTPVAAPSRSSTAMPPVPKSCAAIMRSASPGPRRIRTSPSATIRSTKPAAASRNSAMTLPRHQGRGVRPLFGRELLRD